MRYVRIFALHFQEMLQQRLRNVVWFLIGFINSFVLLLFWRGALRSGQQIANWNSADIQNYYLVLFAVLVFVSTHNELFIAYHDIKNGYLAAHLLKPIRYLYTAICRELPARFIQAFMGLLAIGILSLFGLTISIHIDLPRFLLALGMIALAFILSFAVKAVLASIAFWVTELRGFTELYEVLFLMLSGQILPIHLFPQGLKSFALLTPFPYIVYYPVAALIGTLSAEQMVAIMFVQILMCAGYLSVFHLMWKNGVKKFSGIEQ